MDKHDTLLIASGSPDRRKILRDILQHRYNLLEASSPSQAMLLLEQNTACIAALVMDIDLLQSVDITFYQTPSFAPLLRKVPSIVICTQEDPELVSKIFRGGASDVIPIHYDGESMLRRIENLVQLHLHKQYLEAMVQEQADILRHSNDTMVDVLSSIIEYRSVESGQHILRIRRFTQILLEEVICCCPEYGLDSRAVALISSAAALHDIGKIAIPDAILMKPGKLTQEEREVMKTHALTGCQILDSLVDIGDQEYLRYAHNICHYHHERWDGNGYPEGLKGDQIPICAQVVGLADVYDALTSKRVYKDAYSYAQAANMILKGECGVFSPQLLECFKHITNEFEDLARSYADGLSPSSEHFDTRLPGPAPKEENSLERIRAKYQALVHYINGLLMEVDLDRDLYHLIYNPYPELHWLTQATTFSQISSILRQRLLTDRDRHQLDRILQHIPEFVAQDLRRATFQFQLCLGPDQKDGFFEITLLRITPIDVNRRTLAILFRPTAGQAIPSQTAPILSDSSCLCRFDNSLTLVQLGSHILQLAGYTPQELSDQFGNRLIELVLPEDRKTMLRSLRTQLHSGPTAEVEYRVRHKDGRLLWILDRARISTGPDGLEYLNSYLTDITETRREYDALLDKLRRYEIILSQTENVLFEWDVIQDSIYFSDTWEHLFGFPPIQGNVRNILASGAFFHPDDPEILLERIQALKDGSAYETAEVRIASSQGRYVWYRFRATAIRDAQGTLTSIAGIILNIDAEKQAQRLLQERAERDSLTKLLNKTAGRKRAEEHLLQNPGTSNTLLIIDLDNFKQINDRYGHLFGDAVLCRAARAIEKLFRSQDIVARIGGDEFLVLMRGVSDRKLIASRCQQLLGIFSRLVRNSDQSLPLGCSIGVALSPEHGTDYYELFKHADLALYQAKKAGKHHFRFYETEEIVPFPPQDPITAVNNKIDSDSQPGLARDSIVRYAFHQLYTAREVDPAINRILALVGQQMNVSRVYIFENSDDNRFCTNTYEWCNTGITPQIQNLHQISYETDIPGYEDNFDESGIFYCPDTHLLPQRAYDIVAPQGILSMLQCAIRENGIFRGYIGFDECVTQRLWTQDQISSLQYFSEMLSMFLLHHRQQQKAMAKADEMNTILSNQQGWIYIIRSDTYALHYVNERVRAFAPQLELGQPCYQAIWGHDRLCPGCPLANLSGNKPTSTILIDKKTNTPLLMDVTPIHWQGKNCLLINCRALPQYPECNGN